MHSVRVECAGIFEFLAPSSERCDALRKVLINESKLRNDGEMMPILREPEIGGAFELIDAV